jgi:DNA topoisomerase II
MSDRQIELQKKYADVTMREHVLKKDMWTGPRKIITQNAYVATSISPIVYEYREIMTSPALEKIFDEIIVNVIDHYQRNHQGKKSKVTYMKVNIKNDIISVENDGPGIEVELHPQFKKYIPEVVSTLYLKGENLKKADNDITGGTNGLGMKLTNTYSKSFTLETFDAVNGKLYVQCSHDNMSVIDKPIVKTLKNGIPHTTFTFTPDFEKLGYDKFIGTQYEADFIAIVRTRLIMAKMYARDLTVTFNDEEIVLTDMTTLSRRIFGDDVEPFNTIIKGTDFNWEVCAVTVKNDKNLTYFANVNGVIISMSDKNTPIMHIYNQIYEKLKTKITGAAKDKIKMTKALLYSHLVLFVNAKIPNSMISWDGQRKDICSVELKLLKPYVMPESVVNKIALAVKNAIIANLLEETEDFENDKNVKKDKYDKYKKAEFAGHKTKKYNTRLLFPEGDSAETMVKLGLQYIGGFEYNGICNLGGNIINARKEINIIIQGKKQLKVLSAKLKNNELFKFLTQHLGLTLGYNYDPDSLSYQDEINELKYGCFVVCVDQDLDGIGKIFSLFVNIFHVFWPNLLKAGYIKRFATPILRIFKNTKKSDWIDFYDDYEYKEWQNSPEYNKNWATKYYKGLAGHELPFVTFMFKHFNETLFTYMPDQSTDDFFNIYFGKDADERKDVLSSAVELPSVELKQLQLTTKQVSLSFHLNFDTKSQKLSNIKQKLHDIIGGMNESGRKIYYGCYHYFKNSNEEIKVFQLAGYIASKSKYHHGDMSLNNSIRQKGFIAIGGKQLPVLLGDGQWGSRLQGGADAGSPRYITCTFNKDLMNLIYPPADNWSLKYVFDEGEFIEPEYYVPIVPMAILESICMPADGWKIEVHARDLIEVVNSLKRIISLRKLSIDISQIVLNKLKPFIDPRFKGKYIEYLGDSYTIGCYVEKRSENTIVITELPIGVWNDVYCKMLDGKIEKGNGKTIVEYMDHSTPTDVNIKIKIHPSFWAELDKYANKMCDGITEFFLLREKMSSALNFTLPDGSVGSFTDYNAPIKIWFPYREAAYISRYEHDITLLELEIIQLENEIRYSKAAKELRIHEIKDEEAAATLLQKHDYVKLNHHILNSPGTNTAVELKVKVLGQFADDNTKRSMKINYDYLLDISDRNKLATVITKKIEKRDKLIAELERLKSLTIYDIWIEELDKLIAVYNKGISEIWGVDFTLDKDVKTTKKSSKK